VNDAPAPQRRGWLRGCLLRGLVVVAVLVALFFAIGLAFDQGDDANTPAREFNAGLAESYERGDVSFLASEHIYVTRLEDGSFVALYDKSPKQQEIDSSCRVAFDETAQLGPLPQLTGFTGAFVEECEGTRGVWRADGERAYGAGYGNLDRFATEVNAAGDLIIDTEFRTCTRSQGVVGVPPFNETTCRHGG
jgi:hypothetical protein